MNVNNLKQIGLAMHDYNTGVGTFPMGGTQGDVNIKGFRWAEDNGGMTLFNTIVAPTSSQYTFGYFGLGFGNNSATDQAYQNATSNHPGGASFLFADGRVHYLTSSIGVKTYWALGTKVGGEVISSDSY